MLYQTNSVMYLCGYMDMSTTSGVNPTTGAYTHTQCERRERDGRGAVDVNVDVDENEDKVDFRNGPKTESKSRFTVECLLTAHID